MHNITIINGCAGWTHAGSFELNWWVRNNELGQIANGIAHELIIKINTEV